MHQPSLIGDFGFGVGFLLMAMFVRALTDHELGQEKKSLMRVIFDGFMVPLAIGLAIFRTRLNYETYLHSMQIDAVVAVIILLLFMIINFLDLIFGFVHELALESLAFLYKIKIGSLFNYLGVKIFTIATILAILRCCIDVEHGSLRVAVIAASGALFFYSCAILLGCVFRFAENRATAEKNI